MSKKLFLIFLIAFTFTALDGSKQSALGKQNKPGVQDNEDCMDWNVHMFTWCPLRVLYKDCNGQSQHDIIRIEETKPYKVSGGQMSFECVGGLAPTQTIIYDGYSVVTCNGGAGGVNLNCWTAPGSTNASPKKTPKKP